MNDVKRLARWTGWCDPCETERPLVLTETGQRGFRAWLGGIGAEDRTLTLTCLVCGEWQEVLPDEADPADLADASTSPLVALRPLGARQILVRSVLVTPYPAEPVRLTPAPTTTSLPAALTPADSTLDLLAEGLDLIAVAAS